MSNQPKDPEKFLTEESIGMRVPDPTIEQRLDGVTGKHTFELCLFETFLRTRKFLDKHGDVAKEDKLNHLYGLKAEILHYCIPSKIDWKKYIGPNGHAQGQLIIKPDSNSDVYYRLMASRLFTLEPWECSRFLDFQFVHCVLNGSESKTNSKLPLKITFLQYLDYYVTHMVSSNMAFRRDDILKELTDWNRQKLNSLSDEELKKYYEYKFDPNAKPSNRLMSSTQMQPQYAGCNDKLLKEYFGLLSSIQNEDNIPFAPENSIQFLLWRWFGVGAPPKESELVVYLSLDQLIYFIREFLTNFQIDKISDRKHISQKQFVDLAYESLSSLFGETSASTVYKKFTGFAERGYHSNLDWRNNETLRKAIKK